MPRLLIPELIKLELPKLYVRRTILDSKYQGTPNPGMYIFGDRCHDVLYAGYTKDAQIRPGGHKEFVEDGLKMINDGIPYDYVNQIEVQSSYIANGVEMLIHHFIPPIHKNKRKNVAHPLNLEKEYNDCGEIRELKLHELLNLKKIDR